MKKPDQNKKELHDIIFLSVLCVFILAFGILIFALPQKDFSDKENRELQTFPGFSARSFASGDFTRKISDFYTDQFPLRNAFTAIKTVCETALLKRENGDIIFGEDGYLIERAEYQSYDFLNTNLQAIKEFEDRCGKDVCVAIMPRAIDVLESKLPAVYVGGRYQKAAEYIRNAGYGEIFGEMKADFSSRIEQGEDVWYHTDHHWTTLGAYYAYAALGEKLGYTPYPTDHFDTETASGNFLGTSFSSSGLSSAEPDKILYFRYEGDENYTTEICDSMSANSKSFKGFYAREYLEVKDKYSSFIGGNNGLVRITHDGEEREKLLIVKDSFAHSIAPFLALHYDLVIVDPRYYKQSIAELAETENINRVLILCNADTLATSDAFRALMLGLGK